MDISFVGLGKLGLPLACTLAGSGNRVWGIDKNPYFIENLGNDNLPFYEPGLDEIFPNKNFVDFSDSYESIISDTDATIILVSTQSDDGYSSANVEAALEELSISLKESKKDYHLIVLSSTVPPGSISKLIKLVEDNSDRIYGEGFGFSYVPDFVRLGCVIKDFKNPEFFMFGANNQKDIDLTKSIWKDYHDNDPPFKTLTLEEAEVAKVSLNAYLVNKITFANFLGEICDGMDNVNIHNVTDVVGLDKRVSPYFFGYGMPYGGACFPRDTSAFIKFAASRDKVAKNLLFADEVNHMLYQSICRKIDPYSKVSILGVSFKPNSPVTIGSPSVVILEYLKSQNKETYCHDFIEETFDNLKMFSGLEFKSYSIGGCIENSDVVILMHPDKRYSQFDFSDVEVVDYWGIL